MAKRSRRQRRSGKEQKAILSNILQEAFLRFLEDHPANRISKNLRRMLIEYLMHDGATEAIYLQDLLWDLDGLFALLDAAEESDNL